MEDEGDYQIHYSDIGTVIAEGTGEAHLFTVRRDDNAQLVAVEGIEGASRLTEGQRIYCVYDLLSGPQENAAGSKSYDIRVVGFDKILTKPIRIVTELEEVGESAFADLGSDKIKIYQASIGDNHLNLEFMYWRGKNNSAKHLITLVWDDTRIDEEMLYFRLYHNAYNDIFKEGNELEYAYGLASFPIAETMPEGMSEIFLHVFYNWEYGIKGETEYCGIKYTKDKPSNTYSDPVIGDNIIMAPMDSITFVE